MWVSLRITCLCRNAGPCGALPSTPFRRALPCPALLLLQFLEQFLLSPVRTEDPSEANLFYIPAFNYFYSGACGDLLEGVGWGSGHPAVGDCVCAAGLRILATAADTEPTPVALFVLRMPEASACACLHMP